ncbi:MAG: bifunctional diaminohydroxyphosphoribosylaminopyrimidine deaminase/5-amino-6-(5-phosphoribosylamino)uracil reductase RibD [Calditrichaeota bacterium]|nr:MAG: bifunctional diaminohydroxyphosphoribosylaminopyrimidine deaminase/5-amino-6-(5-phosphoribosylamino)uracil reductase RibD [Calditrichota bacterium]
MKPELFMHRALELAQKGAGFTSPNPMVGAVVVKEGRIIGEGYHPRFGDIHAEAMAIDKAVEPVEGADLYCTLEPCCNGIPRKKTPACSLRLIQERIRRVVVATIDPNPYVNGRGIAQLQEAGIPVEVGLLAPEATFLNEAYFKYIQTGRPFVHLKIAASLDGRIATATGNSRWITDEEARSLVHQMRHRADAILVGIGTVLADNPRLTVRPHRGKQPLRVVLDSRLSIPTTAHLLTDEFRDRTVIFTTAHHSAEARRQIEAGGVRVIVVPPDAAGRVDVQAVLERLGEMGVASVLVEGGQGIFTSFIARNLFDKISFFLAPILLGKGISAIGDLQIQKVQEALSLELVEYRIINRQVLVQGYRNPRGTFGMLAEHITCSPGLLKKSAG